MATTPPGDGFWDERRARRIVPLAFITYSLAYLDKSNYSIGAAGGMVHDLRLSSGLNALIAASFFLGYFLFQIPGTVYAERHSVRRLIAYSTVAWGVLAMAQGLVSSPWALITIRFLLGVVEGGVLPSLVLLLGRWFSRAERGRANAFLILGNPVTVMWLSAVSGALIAATNWRVMFVVEGLPAIGWGIACLKLIKDWPAEAAWLDEAERTALQARLATEAGQTEPEPAPARFAGHLRALRSPVVVALSAQYLLWSVGMYGFIFWLPSIIKQASGEGIGATGLLSAVPYAFAVAAMAFNSRRSDRRGNRVAAVWPWLTAGAAALLGSYLAGGDFPLAYALLIVAGAAMYAPYGPYFAHLTEVAPREVRGTAVAVVNSFGAVGSFAGTYVVGWLRGTSAGDAAAFGFMAVATLASALLMFTVRGGAPAGRRAAAGYGEPAPALRTAGAAEQKES